MDVYRGADKVAEFENYNELRVGENKPAFIYEGNELVYPNPVKDGLVLWYDFSGRTNSDGQRGIAEDLSGNGNHGTLQNFSYSEGSGYDKRGLLFDGIDDFIDAPIPELNLGYDNMTAQIDNEIYSYKDGQVMSVKLGEARSELDGIEVGGRNYISNLKNNWVVGSINGNTGEDFVISTALRSDYVYLKSGDYLLNVSFEGEENEELRTYVYSYDGDKSGVQSKSSWNFQYPLSFAIGSDERYIRVILRIFKDGVAKSARLDDLSSKIKIKLEKGNKATDWTPAPEDTEAKITTVQKQKIQSYKLYNRALTEEEITHNFNVENKRINKEGDIR